jgi:hypothetical protein
MRLLLSIEADIGSVNALQEGPFTRYTPLSTVDELWQHEEMIQMMKICPTSDFQTESAIPSINNEKLEMPVIAEASDDSEGNHHYPIIIRQKGDIRVKRRK